MFFYNIGEWLLDWVFPRFCLGCSQEGDFLCRECGITKIRSKKNQVCPDCRRSSPNGEVCHECKRNWNLDGLAVAVETNKLVRELVHAYKYQDLLGAGEILSKWQLEVAVGKYQIVTSVPLHWRRKWWRGYNQAEMLGKILAKKLDLPYRNCLTRKVFTVPQVELNKKDRMDNVKEVFEVVSKNIVGENVLIVDDVCTTMATLNECAKELKRGGAKKVYGVVVARGV